MAQDIINRVGAQDSRDPVLREASDEAIMLDVQRGNGDAFAVLFDRYHRLVLLTALKIVRDVSEAEEVTQSVFFEIYRTAGKFDPARGTLKVWLLQFAYHRSINRRNYLVLRQFYNRPDLEEAMVWEAAAKTTPRVPAQELKQVVQEALTTLPETQKGVVEKVIFEGLTLREVAQRSGSSYNAVRNRYYRGLDHLRGSLVERPAIVAKEGIVGLGEVSRGKA